MMDDMDHSGMDHSGMDSGDNMDGMDGTDKGNTGGMDHSGMTASHGTTFFASRYATILFEGASTTSIGGLVGAVIIVLIVSVIYEVLRRYKAYFDNPLGRCWCPCGDQNSSVMQMRGVEREQSPPTVSEVDVNPPKQDHTVIVPGSQNKHVKTAKKIQNMCLRHRTFYTAISISLHLVSLTLSYFLMLVAMTFNVWLFLAVILGSGLGKLINMTLLEDVVGDSPQSHSHCNMP